MNLFNVLPVKWFCLLSCLIMVMMATEVARAGSDVTEQQDDSLGNLKEPSTLLPQIDARGTQKDSIFAASPLGPLHDSTSKWKQELYNKTGLRLGFALTHVFQAITDSLPDQDEAGTASTSDLLGSWELINRGKPTVGKLVAHAQARWDYGTTGPEELGFNSLGGVIGTALAVSIRLLYVPRYMPLLETF